MSSMEIVDRPAPPPRLLRSPEDAEQAAAEWMRWLGFADARVTPPGADGGVDVTSAGALAQVKAHMAPVGRPDLQGLFGVAAAERKRPLFFSLTGYTREALDWAGHVSLPLFRFDPTGGLEAANASGAELLGPVAPVPAPPGGPLGWTPGVTDAAAALAVRLLRRGALVRERVRWVRQGYVWVQAVRLDHTLPARKGTVVHRVTHLAFDLVGGELCALPAGDPALLPRNVEVMGAAVKAPDLVRRCHETFVKWATAAQPAARDRHAAVLAALGVPDGALSVEATATERLAVPVTVGLLATRVGERIVVVGAWRRTPHLTALSETLTARLPWATGQLEATGRPVS